MATPTPDYSGLHRPNWVLRLSLTILFLVIAAGSIGYFAWEQRAELKQLEAQNTKLTNDMSGVDGERTEAARVASKLATCQKKAELQSDRCKKVEAGFTEMEGNLEATRTELEEVRKQREQTSARLDAFKKLTDKLRKMIDAGQLAVEIRDGRMLVKLPAEVLFPSGSAKLSRAGELAVMEVAIALRQLPDRRFMVSGHTDNRPLENSGKSEFADNWELSSARALTVTRFLVEARMDPHRVVAAGHGEFSPVADNRTAKGRQENRRIEIELLPNIEELPSLPDQPTTDPTKQPPPSPNQVRAN